MIAANKKKKQPSPSLPPWLRDAAKYLCGPAWPATIIVLMVALLAGGWYLAWHKVRPHVLSSEAYVVTPEKVTLTETPPWIHSDLRAEGFRAASLDEPLSIMDDDLAERIDNAFSQLAWVAKVRRVRKHDGGRVTVDLQYRRPVCMVEVGESWDPVDGEGVLLPRADFSQVEASHYPLLVGIETRPVGAEGEQWGDARVLGGAEIAAALIDAWHELELRQIVPSDPLATGVAEEPTYTLRTRSGSRIVWGRAPGSDTPGELPAADKVARLRQYFKKYGTLDGPDGRPQDLDIHRLRVSGRVGRGME